MVILQIPHVHQKQWQGEEQMHHHAWNAAIVDEHTP